MLTTPHENILEVILRRSENTGATDVLQQVHDRYGEIIPSKTPDYRELALSFLNLFDVDTRENILHSPWFLHMISHKISIHILYEELKAVREILSAPGPHPVITIIERLAFGEKYIRYKLNGKILPSTILASDDYIHREDFITLMVLSTYQE